MVGAAIAHRPWIQAQTPTQAAVANAIAAISGGQVTSPGRTGVAAIHTTKAELATADATVIAAPRARERPFMK